MVDNAVEGRQVRVLVVGAGPVGAVAAYRLACLGIDTVLLEAGADCAEDMRASTLHPPTLDMLDELGLLDDLMTQGLKAPIYQYRNRRTGNIIELDLGELRDEVRFPFRLQCEQYKLARLATARLAVHPYGQMLFGRRLLSFQQHAAGVTVQVETSTAIEQYRCDFLIGTDGASSTVRKLAGIDFEGFTWPERFLTLSTDYPIGQRLRDLAEVNYVADADEWCVLLRVPKLWRVLVPTAADETDAYLTSDAKKAQVFAGLIGEPGVETYHRTVYRVHQRVATEFRIGRVIIAGDAAHLNNPLGGFGMNSGIHDVWNLTTKLRNIMQDGGDCDFELDRYARQRRTVAREFVQAQTIQNKLALEGRKTTNGSSPEADLTALLRNAAQRRAYLRRQAMVTSLEREAEIT